MTPINAFFYVSFLFLIFNTYRDLKTHTTDARLNAIIYGALFMVIIQTYHSWMIIVWFILSLVILTILKKYGFAQGDITALRWLIIGWCIISPMYLIVFLLNFLVWVVITRVTWRWVGLSGGAPCYPAILFAYGCTIAIYLNLV